MQSNTFNSKEIPVKGPAIDSQTGRIVGVLAFAGIVTTLVSTLVIPLLGQLPRLLHTTASNASWVVTVTLLAGAVATPVTGRLGGLYGTRRIMLACTVPLIVGSVICALSSSLAPMLIGRALQGAGFGMIPLGISALRNLLPAKHLPSAIAIMSSSMGIGGALGLPLAAVVAQNTSWRILFWGVAALSLLVAVLILRFVPATPASGAGGRFDGLGALGLSVGLVCLLLAVSKGGDWGWTSATILSFFAASTVVLGSWGWWELRTRNPLVDLRVAAGKQVLLTNTVTFVIGFSMYFQSLLVPQIRQLPESTGYGLGQSMMTMGLWSAPPGLVMMAVSPLGARLSSLRGPKTTLLSGCLVIALGYGSSMYLMGTTWGLLMVTCSVAAGIGLAYGALPALIMGAVPQSEIASANSVNSLMRSIGGTVSAAVSGVVLAQLSIDFLGHTIPTENGFRTGLLIGFVTALIAAAISLAIPARPDSPSQQQSATVQPPAESKV